MSNKNKLYSLLVSCSVIPYSILADDTLDPNTEGCRLHYSHLAHDHDRINNENLGDLASQNPIHITEKDAKESLRDTLLSSFTKEQDIKQYKDLEDSYVEMMAKTQDARAHNQDLSNLDKQKIHDLEESLLASKAAQSLLMQEKAEKDIDDLNTKIPGKKRSKHVKERIEEASTKFFKSIIPSKFRHEEIDVLTLDGGGIRGIGTLCMLSILEMRTGQKVWELFDRIYGTSTGGLAGILLSRGHSATEVLDLYFDNADRIFNRSWWDSFSNPLGLMRANFNAEGLESLIKEKVGDAKLADVKIPVAVTTVNKKTNRMVCLSSEDEATKDVTMLEAGRATVKPPVRGPVFKLVMLFNGVSLCPSGTSQYR